MARAEAEDEKRLRVVEVKEMKKKKKNRKKRKKKMEEKERRPSRIRRETEHHGEPHRRSHGTCKGDE